jgi:hypothetical protein
MSVLKDFKDKPLSEVPGKLKVYQASIDLATGDGKEVNGVFDLSGKALIDACQQQPQDLVFYNLMFQECKTIEDYLTNRMETVEAEVYKSHLESNARALGARDLTMYVKSDPQYIEAKTVLLEVTLVRRQLEAIVEALQTLGWALSNITKLKVSEMDHTVL